MKIDIREATQRDVLPLRHSVLRPTLPVSAAMFDIDNEVGVKHFAAVYGGLEIVGVATVGPSEPPESHRLPENAGRFIYRIRGMAVDSSRRGMGIGAKLLDACLVAAAEGGADAVWADARVDALSLYTRAGMQELGEVHFIPEIGKHQLVWSTVRRAPKRRPLPR